MVVELAVAAKAKYLITYNIADFKKAEQFNINIVKPKEFLELIGEVS